jgi:N-ethylmaleimide reductase
MSDSNPSALFSHLAEKLNRFRLAYLHVSEPRIKGNVAIEDGLPPAALGAIAQNLHGKDYRSGWF